MNGIYGSSNKNDNISVQNRVGLDLDGMAVQTNYDTSASKDWVRWYDSSANKILRTAVTAKVLMRNEKKSKRVSTCR